MSNWILPLWCCDTKWTSVVIGNRSELRKTLDLSDCAGCKFHATSQLNGNEQRVNQMSEDYTFFIAIFKI